jgi:hypothetical protein
MPGDPLDEMIDKMCQADPIELELDEDDEPAGPPLAPDELVEARQVLARWQTPGAFKATAGAFSSRCRSKDWFNDPRLKFLHDAFVLARFALTEKAERVRLTEQSEQWPDGYVQRDGRIHNIEITSTHGGRKLGAEYREVTGPTMDPVENWVARADSVPKYLDDAIRSKSEKRYGSPCWLVVYLNISEYGIRQKETEGIIAQTKARYESSFEAISVLWKGRIY